MNKEERDKFKSLARLYNTSKRIRVVLPGLPRVRYLAENQERAFNDDLDAWKQEVIERKTDAILALADERDADPHELAKVADLLLEMVPPESRGKKGVDHASVIGLVALEMSKGKSQQVACDLAGATTKTFRTLKKKYPHYWRISQKYSAKLPEDVMRKIFTRSAGK